MIDFAKPRRKHLWDWHLPQAFQVNCWCNPVVQYYGDCEPLVFHRPDPEYVFWNHGEQGPQVSWLA